MVQLVGFTIEIIVLCLLICITENIHVTEGRKYFPRGLYDAPPVACWPALYYTYYGQIKYMTKQAT